MNYPLLPKTPWNGLRHEGGPYEPEWISNEDGYTADQMLDYAAACVAAERERCAMVCDARAESTTVNDSDLLVWRLAAELIRALPAKPSAGL